MATSVISDSTFKMESSNNKYVIDPQKTGAFIKYLRESRNMTQEELASKIFLTRKAISKWENGKSVPSIDTLTILSGILDVSLEELIAGEFIAHKRITNVKYVFKVLKNKCFKWLGLAFCIFVLIVIVGIFVYNLNADKVYLINYEDENFTISNGVIFLSKKGSYVNVGNIYSDIDGIDNSTVYNVTLYYVSKDMKTELIHFNSEKSLTIDKDTYVTLKDLERKHKFGDLYFEVKFADVNGEVRTFDLALLVTKSPTNNIDNILNKDELPLLQNPAENEDKVDLNFLFNMEEKEINRCYSGKVIKVDGKDYVLSFDSENSILAMKNKNIIECAIYFVHKRIAFDNSFMPVSLDETLMIKKDNLEEFDYDLLNKLVKLLKNIPCGHSK